MVIFKKFYRQNLIQIYTKTDQIAPFKKFPPLDLRHANFQIWGKKFLPPPPPDKSRGRPCSLTFTSFFMNSV